MLVNYKSVLKIIFVFIFLGYFGLQGTAQIAVNSPYSRYGVGDLVTRQNAYNFSMGGVAYAISNPRFINPFNPASNHAFDSLSFIFTGGIASRLGQLNNEEFSSNSEFITLGYLLFGFPITKWLKSSIGILPYSNVGYNIIDEQDLEDIGRTNFYYLGSGGLNEFYYNMSVQLHKNFSVGAKASYMFGKSEMGQFVTFPDSVHVLSTRVDNYVEVGDMFFEFGAQYDKKISKNLTLGLGAVYLPAQQISATKSYVARSYFGNTTGIGFYKDTIETRIENTGSITLPVKYGMGIMLRKTNNWMIAADYEWQNWSEFKAFGAADSLKNSMQFSVGGEYLPKPGGFVNYFSRVSYRLGFRYNQTYVYLRDTQINEFGISFGLGLPLPRTYSSVNVAVEIGRRGTTALGLIQENFIKFTLGVSVNERWFVKRRYN
ncbi:MAG: hypothetical protein B6D64_03505 [Bacteroidetes bacterium 4484_276]|nr:MAG: hypothetical protein B6D64_03505 [Bacteroidetes bacterium 4484_276]